MTSLCAADKLALFFFSSWNACVIVCLKVIQLQMGCYFMHNALVCVVALFSCAYFVLVVRCKNYFYVTVGDGSNVHFFMDCIIQLSPLVLTAGQWKLASLYQMDPPKLDHKY